MPLRISQGSKGIHWDSILGRSRVRDNDYFPGKLLLRVIYGSVFEHSSDSFLHEPAQCVDEDDEAEDGDGAFDERGVGAVAVADPECREIGEVFEAVCGTKQCNDAGADDAMGGHANGEHARNKKRAAECEASAQHGKAFIFAERAEGDDS